MTYVQQHSQDQHMHKLPPSANMYSMQQQKWLKWNAVVGLPLKVESYQQLVHSVPGLHNMEASLVKYQQVVCDL